MSKVKQTTAWLCGFSVFLLLASCWEGDSKRLENAFDRAKYGTTRITLAISDDSTPIEVGQKVSFIVTAYDKDDAQRIIPSDRINWSLSCSEPGCAFLSDKGVLTGKGDGIATVTANYDILSASVDVEVSSAVLTKIEIKRVNDASPMNRCQPFELIAEGTYTKGGVDETPARNITHLATWSSESADATVYRDNAGKVFFSSSIANPVTIKATHASFESGQVLGEKDFTVANVLPEVTVSPSGLTTLFTGQTRQYTATGVWPDVASSQEITHNLSWNSSESITAAFNGNTTSSILSSRQDGLLTGISASNGGVTISALCGGDVVATQPVVVQELQIESIKIYREGDATDYSQRASPYDISLGNTTTFRAEAVYVGGSVEGAPTNITHDCRWRKIESNADAITVGDADQIDADNTIQKRGNVTGDLLTENASPDYARVEVTLKSCDGEADCKKTTFDVRIVQ